MSIIVDENILGIWYVALAEDFDVMCALARDGNGYKVMGRTRTYASLDPWDVKDRKKWFGGPIEASDDDNAVAWTRNHMVTISAGFVMTFKQEHTPQLFELVRGAASVEKFAETLQAMPWAHSQGGTLQ